MNEFKYLPTKATGKIDGGRLLHGTPGTRTRALREGGAERGVRSALEPAGAGVRRLPAAAPRAGGRRHCPRPALPHRQARTVAAQTSRGGREGGWRRVKPAVNARHTPRSQEALGVTL